MRFSGFSGFSGFAWLFVDLIGLIAGLTGLLVGLKGLFVDDTRLYGYVSIHIYHDHVRPF